MTTLNANDRDNGSIVLPATVGEWTRSSTHQRITADEIFDYMDGAGELYLGYRFDVLDVFEYRAPSREGIVAELYWLRSSDDAYGLLSNDWGGEPIALAEAAKGKASRPPRALYGGGLLRIWSGRLYVRIMAERETEEARRAVLELGRSVVKGRRDPPPPELAAALPPHVAPDFSLRADRVCFFRSYLVLNAAYFLSPSNILSLDQSVEGVVASYPRAPASGGRAPVTLVLIRYQDPATAEEALAGFHRAYLPDKRGADRPVPFPERQVARVEDGWMGSSRAGRSAALVLGCPSEELVAASLDRAVTSLKGLEANHE